MQRFAELFFMATENPYFVSIVQVVSFLFNLTCLLIVGAYYIASEKQKRATLVLLLVFLSLSVGDIYWAIFPLNQCNVLSISPFFWRAFGRINWSFVVVEHLAIPFFIEHLLGGQLRANPLYGAIRWTLGLALAGTFIVIGILYPYRPTYVDVFAAQVIYFYVTIISVQTVIMVTRVLATKKLPKILKHQAKIFTFVFFVPYSIAFILSSNPFSYKLGYSVSGYTFVTLMTIFSTWAMYFCLRRLLKFRFLDTKKHVIGRFNYDFMRTFNETLFSLGGKVGITEARYISRRFISDVLKIDEKRVQVGVKSVVKQPEFNENKRDSIEDRVGPKGTYGLLKEYLLESRILIKDEIEFSHFYEEREEYEEAIRFLDEIESEIFLPIYQEEELVGYICIDVDTRAKGFYNDVERDELVLFASHLGALLSLLRKKDFKTLVSRIRTLKDELYSQYQKNTRYQESLREFIDAAGSKTVGVMFYRSREFVFGNKSAQRMIECDPNIERGNPITKLLRKTVANVRQYGVPQTAEYKTDDKRLAILGVPSFGKGGIVLIILPSSGAQAVQLQLRFLGDSAEWDYLLYLETTESGRVVNEFIPSVKGKFLDFRVGVLKAALNKKVTFLKMDDGDAKLIIKVFQEISLRQRLHTVTLVEPEKDGEIALQLFGLNPIMDFEKKHPAILESLDKQGILHIRNIQFLSEETQLYLAEFVKYGTFRYLRSDKKVDCDVRIVCSSTVDLSTHVKQGTFSCELFKQLDDLSLSMPNLSELTGDEFYELAQEVCCQLLKSNLLKQVIVLTDKELGKLNAQRPVTLHGLRKKVCQILCRKSKGRVQLKEIVSFEPAHYAEDDEFRRAMMMGKEALKDPAIMNFLWNRLNSYAEIGTLLGVDRSTIYRRLKKHKII